jgi:aspartyl-tRNA(Asn)/glutamyl-tRNA(Gln) amidotransferase subunit A
MSLLEKHLMSIEDESLIEKSHSLMLRKIELDNSGSCWHKEEVRKESEKELSRLLSLSKDEKISMPFYGLTVGLKDLFCIKGLTTTAGSKILENFISPYDSHVWQTLKNRGSLIGGKLAMDEFAMGSFSNTSSFGKVSIPGYEDRTAGGSSGGSGAAMLSDIFDYTVGSDTGGSVRLPASFCSVVGYKPSYGAFSRYGMISYASSLDQAGFFTKDLEDLKYLLESNISIKDKLDTTASSLGDYNIVSKSSYKVAYFPELLDKEGIQEEVKKAYALQIQELKSKGIELIPIRVPLMEMAAQIYYIIACSEASSNLAKFQGVYFGKKLVDEKFEGSFWEQAAQYRGKYFGLEVQKRIMLGSFVLSSENFKTMYEKSWNLRKKLKQDLIDILSNVDVIVLPVSPMVAPKWTDIDKMTSAEIYMSDFMTVPFSLAGLPALSTPGYKDSNGLGIGMQWVGSPMKDYQLLADVMSIKSKE